MSEPLKFVVSEDEANTILAALGKLPFENVADLIVSIKRQGDQQITERQLKLMEAANPNVPEVNTAEQKSD